MDRPRRNDDAWDAEEEGWDEDWDGDQDADSAEAVESADEDTIPCPYCQEPIYEDAVRCPACERYLSAEDAPRSRQAWWIVLGVILGLYAVYRWVSGR